jgi:glycosyltransferase involved in cell wall biosynthesis
MFRNIGMNDYTRPPLDVALLVPCYNAASFAPRLIEMARKQSVPFAEIICYDDGSADGTADLIQSLGVRLLIGKINRGPAYARNQLARAAGTTWIHFHDVDDGLRPDFCERMGEALAGPDTAAVCAVRAIWIDENCPEETVRYPELEDRANLINFAFRNFIHLNAVIYPRKLLLDVGGFCEELRFAEDWDLNLRLAHAGLKFRYVDAPLVTWERHSESTIGRTKAEVIGHYHSRFLDRTRELLGEKYRQDLGEFAFYRAWQLYCQGLNQPAKSHLEVAARCGVRFAQGAGAIERMISNAIGGERMFGLKKLWALARGRATR